MNAPVTAPKAEPTSKRKTSRPASKNKKLPNARCLGQGVSAVASQRAAAILEVLAGERTPRQAAEVLAMSLPYFYLLERKALHGLLQACQPQPKGPPAPSPERKLEALELELARCRRECQRQEALVRATQRAVGLPVPPSSPARKDKERERERPEDTKGVRRRRRRPVVRALRAARTLRQNLSGSTPAPELQPAVTEERSPLSTTCGKEMEHVAASG